MNKSNELIKSFLTFINNQFCFACKKEILLFVEGRSDKEFYSATFKDIDIAFNENLNKNVCIDFTDKLGDGFGNPYMKKEFQSIKAPNFDFVIAATHKNNLPDNCKFDCFGFIDKDFENMKKDAYGEDLKFYKHRNLAQTKYHDRETTLLYYYMPKLYHSLKSKHSDEDNYYFIEKMGEILYFSTCQGVIESYSLENRFCDMREITRNNFRDEQKWTSVCNKHNYTITSFNFVEYLKCCRDENTNPWFKGGVNGCIEKIKHIDKDALKIAVKDWLEKEQQSDMIEKAFDKSNGHIVCKNIVKLTFKYLGLNDKKESELINLLIPLIKEYDQDFKTTSPVKEYLQYRKDLQNA